MSTPRSHPATLSVALSPDSDDGFNLFAWEHGHVSLETPGVEASFRREPIFALNQAAAEGRFDVVAVSSVFYPRVADTYAVLATGNSIGRNFGPVLVARGGVTLESLAGGRIGVAGRFTTGGVLAAMVCPDAELVEMDFEAIADAVAAGDLDAGVMIHEELLFYPQKGLTAVQDLGVAWCEQTGLPLPVGLNLVRRSLGPELMADIADTCCRSMGWAYSPAHFEEAIAFASTFGRGCARAHVAMFSNADTFRLAEDARRGIDVMAERVHAMGLGPAIGPVEVLGV